MSRRPCYPGLDPGVSAVKTVLRALWPGANEPRLFARPARPARLALTGEAPERVCAPPEILETIEPETALRRACAPSLARFRALYPLLRETFKPAGTAPPFHEYKEASCRTSS